MVIYLDIILLLNLCFNYFILFLTNYLVRAGKKQKQILWGAMVATAIVPIQLFVTHPIVGTVGFKAGFSLVIILAAFGYHGWQLFWKQLSVFYFITFAIGGGLLGIHFMMQEIPEIQGNKMFLYMTNMDGGQVSLILLFLGFPLIWFFTKGRMDRHVKDKLLDDQLYAVSLELNGQTHKTTGYIDSGNQLVDPFTNRPVILCDATYLRQFFSRDDWEGIKAAVTENEFTAFPQAFQKRLVIVPYQGVGGQGGNLYTIRPDKLTILQQGEVFSTKNVLIGIQLANLTVDGQYHCLLHPELVTIKMKKIAS